MDYDLSSLKPSQERRLGVALSQNEGTSDFLRKLQTYLSQTLVGGEGERDYVMSLATRLSAQDVWAHIPAEDLKAAVSRLENRERLDAFVEGLPSEIARTFTDQPSTSISGRRRSRSSGKRGELIDQYAAEIREHLNVAPDLELLTRLVIATGPAIYAAGDEATLKLDELDRLRTDRFVSRLNLGEIPDLPQRLRQEMLRFGFSTGQRIALPVIYYVLLNVLAADRTLTE